MGALAVPEAPVVEVVYTYTTDTAAAVVLLSAAFVLAVVLLDVASVAANDVAANDVAANDIAESGTAADGAAPLASSSAVVDAMAHIVVRSEYSYGLIVRCVAPSSHGIDDARAVHHMHYRNCWWVGRASAADSAEFWGRCSGFVRDCERACLERCQERRLTVRLLADLAYGEGHRTVPGDDSYWVCHGRPCKG